MVFVRRGKSVESDQGDEIEELWDDLLAFIEQGRVIPVVGLELLVIQNGGGNIPLYRAVAQHLLRKYAVSDDGFPAGGSSHPNHELNDAACAIVEARKGHARVNDLYRPVHDILQKRVPVLDFPTVQR